MSDEEEDFGGAVQDSGKVMDDIMKSALKRLEALGDLSVGEDTCLTKA